MAEKTGIGWTDHTWSPWWGCTQVSPACDNCYAMALDRRTGGAHWGPGVPRKVMSETHWKAPLAWDRKAAAAGETRYVFPSMCDPFDNEVPVEWRARFFDLIRVTPHLTWLLLTKRIGNAAKMAEAIGGWPVNAAAGATVINQDEVDRDVPKLLDLRGPRFRFLSVEPMLGPIDFGAIPGGDEKHPWIKPLWGMRHRTSDDFSEGWPRIDWVICGGESGPHARPMQEAWALALRDQCEAADVPFFFKQWSGRTPKANGKALDGREHCARPA